MSLFWWACLRSLSILAAASILATAGCGGGAIEGPGGNDEGAAQTPGSANPSASGGDSNGGSEDGEASETFSWSLPGGDLSVDTIGFLFNVLRAGQCPEIFAEPEDSADLEITAHDGFLTSGQELLYRAASSVCSGDLEAARGHLEGAALTDHPGDCRLYKAIKSVLEQRPQEAIACPAPESMSGGGGTPSETMTSAPEPTSGGDGTPTETTSPAPEPTSGGDVTPAETMSPAPESMSVWDGISSETTAVQPFAVVARAASSPAPRLAAS